MALTSGTRLSGYEILEPLGAGGMGEVYRARDSRLQRDVAVKILPGIFASDPERKSRFEREAQLLASLNHPNIAQIYGVEESGSGPALVMELVEGPTLADVLERRAASAGSRGSYRSGQVDIDALDIARQIADALEAAHERGIIHRDLKPQNVKLRPDGTVKVLDFGLAKALDPLSSGDMPANSPTITNVHTRVGTLLGTAAYMAPEQVKGRAADRRADVWAFGVVLYELIAGVAPFQGETTSEILARVMEREPDWSRIPESTPPAVVRLLERALVKDPKHRLQSIGDARLEIEEALARPSGGPAARTLAAPATRPWLLAIAGVAVLAILGFAGVAMRFETATLPAPAIRASIALPPGLFLDGVGPPELALSPDGRMLAFLAREATGVQRLYVRPLDSESATLVPDSDTAEGPVFSPDSRWVAFAVGVSMMAGVPPELRRYSIDTGLTQKMATVGDYFGGVWLADGSFVYVDRQPGGLWKVDPAGSRQQVVPKFLLDGKELEGNLAWPSLLPGGRHVLLTDWSASSVGVLTVIDLQSRRATRLGIEGAGGQVLPNGYLVYASPTASLVSVPFDLATMSLAGAATAIMPDIAFGRNNMPAFATAPNGTLVYASGYLRGSRREPMRLVRYPASGASTPLPFEPDLLFRGFGLSPDARHLAIGAWDGSLWIYDLRRGTRVKHPLQRIKEVNTLAWSPDGRRLAVAGNMSDSTNWGAVVTSIDQPDREDLVAQSADSEVHLAGWSPDAKSIFGWSNTGQMRGAIFRVDDGRERQTVSVEPALVNQVNVSPDGRWLAYVAVGTGALDLFVMPTSGKGTRLAVTSRGGASPRWARDGKQLYFRRGPALMAVDVAVEGDSLHLGAERTVFEEDLGREYDVGPAGEFYAMQPVPGAGDQTSIQIRTNWFEEVERLMRRR
ncbi:MAG TPA: protein kinase [Vicinamibacterales bacterium]|nr:protein kinase [Vicinamibacterales bacterium]